ncbi:MAG: type II secretion system F family protein, partial [Thermoguttaceae bacterium]
MTFAYRVRDPLGHVLSGTLAASSVDDAAQQLRNDGFHILEIEDDGEGLAELFPRRVSRKDLVFATSQLAIMVDAGITLSAALAGMEQQQPNPTLKKVLADLRHSVEDGESFSTALARHPRLFDKTYVSLVRASEASGNMGPMLERIASYL